MADQDQTTSPPPEEQPPDQAAAQARAGYQQPAEPVSPSTPPPPQDEPLDSALREEIEREVDAAFADVTPLEADDEDEPAAEPEADIQEPPLAAEPAFDDDEDSDQEAEQILMEEVAQLAAAEEKVRPSGRPTQETTPGPEETPPEPAPTTADAVAETERQALLTEQPADSRPQASSEEVPRDQPAQAGPGSLLLLPLRVLVLLLGIIDLPFRRLGPNTRSVLGKFAIGYLVAAALIFAYVFLRPLF